MQHDTFETSDFGLATTIIATIGAPILAVDHSNPGKTKFLFNRDDIPDDLVDAFWKLDLRIEPNTYILAQRCLQNRIRDGLEDESIPTGICM